MTSNHVVYDVSEVESGISFVDAFDLVNVPGQQSFSGNTGEIIVQEGANFSANAYVTYTP